MQKFGQCVGKEFAGKTAGLVSQSTDEHTRKKFFRWAAVLLLAVTAAYWNHFYNGFHFDDYHTIVNNSYIRSISNIPSFFTNATTFSSLPTNQSYRPLVSTTLAIDYFLGNGNVFFFHLSTFILFLFQGVLMYFLYLAILNRAVRAPVNGFVALAAVAWYLLHPANAETINYIIARSDSLSTLFILVAFVIYLYWSLGKRLHLYLIPFALACLAKPVAAVFAPLLFVYTYFFEKDNRSGLARLGASLKNTAPTLLACFLIMPFIKMMDPPTWRAGGTSALHYIITQPFVLLYYFGTFFAPLHLSADTDWTTLPSLLDVRFLIGTFSLVALLVIAVLTARREQWKPISFGLLWFLITLLPTSLMPLAEVMNDHRLFLPYVGLAISVCWTLHLILAAASSRFKSRELFYRGVMGVTVVALAGYAYGTHVRNDVWWNDETLWRDVTIKSPRNGRGLMNYGLALMARGDYEKAEKYFRDAMLITPAYPFLYVNMGVLKGATGKAAEAEPYFLTALRLNPEWPDGNYFYASFLYKQKRYDEAVAYAQKTLQLASAHLDARRLLMDIYFERARFNELKALARQTLLLAPGDKQAASYLSDSKKEVAH